MNKRFLLTPFLIAFVYSSISFFGCTKKNYSNENARLSPEWVKNAVIEEINLRSSLKTGTFKTLEAQIPELKNRGVTILSLTPIHPIGELNRNGVLGSPDAVKDFYTVNPVFGTLDDFTSLVRTVHEQGLKIIINLVINQAAWDNTILMEHPEWFVHNEEGAIVAPDSESSDVAQIDFNQHELRKYMIAMMKFWVLEIGIDGFLCKNGNSIPADFWDIARSELEKIKPVVLISEGCSPENSMQAFDIICQSKLDNAIRTIIIGTAPASIMDDSLNAEFQQYKKGSLQLHFKKDITPDRMTSVPQIEKAIAILAFTLPGVPYFSNDSELVNKKINALNALYRDLSTLRRKHPALQFGEYQYMQNSDRAHLFSFIRFSGKDSVLVVVNFTQREKEEDIQMPPHVSFVWHDQLTNVRVQCENSRLRVTVLPFGCLILSPSSEKEEP